MITKIFKDLIKNKEYIDGYGIYKNSFNVLNNNIYFVYEEKKIKRLFVYEKEDTIIDFDFYDKFNFENNYSIILADLTNRNAKALAKRFDFLNPVKRDNFKYSFGLGDRLGFASLAHLELFKNYHVLPVLAQQSIRELMLTGRTYDDVLSSARYASFITGYKKGFGADGDHLKHAYEIEYAIKSGFPMITLDLSDHINNNVYNLTGDDLKKEYLKLGKNCRDYYEKTYLNKEFEIFNNIIKIDEESLYKAVLTYHDALIFAEVIYIDYVKKYNLDFEISIDETVNKTKLEDHVFIANELINNFEIKLNTLAPKFHGEFQKGIDYVGDINLFKEEYIVHQDIARYYGYKLSIHSGSDKFSVFPIIGDVSKEDGFHVKTAGTNWLEALRVVGRVDSDLLIKIYEFAVNNLDKAKKYYHIDTKRENAKDSSYFSDDIDNMLNEVESRQILHITHGLILNYKEDGYYVFKDKIYEILDNNFDLYKEFLNKHIKRHLDLLGLK